MIDKALFMFRKALVTFGRRMFEERQKERFYPFALETTTKVNVGTMPGRFHSYVTERGTRLWAFARPEDVVMARRVAGEEVVER